MVVRHFADGFTEGLDFSVVKIRRGERDVAKRGDLERQPDVRLVGVLWSAFGPAVAFSYSAVQFTLGALLVARLR